ncbi:MAG: hypothetical protein Q4E50_06215, partial [Tissierellia bacterium]|nr:hypothetical protein [Tissierellia bacterium]
KLPIFKDRYLCGKSSFASKTRVFSFLIIYSSIFPEKVMFTFVKESDFDIQLVTLKDIVVLLFYCLITLILKENEHFVF